MITPAFGLTTTERVLPKLALDFTTASLDARVTFTRTTGASNPATYVNSGGVITTATNNQPRFDYDPVALTCKGLLIEESRVNSQLQSNGFDQATWWTAFRATPTPNATTSPDGTGNAYKLVEDTTASNTHQVVGGNIALTNAATYTYSFYAKAAERSQIEVGRSTTALPSFSHFFDLSTVTATTGGVGTAFITAAGNGWYRCVGTLTAIATANGNVAIRLATGGTSIYTGNGTSGAYLYGAQFEAGAFATSYIPTTTTALTRNADVATMTGTNFSDWYNAGTGAFNCTVLPKSATGTKPILQFDDATALNTITMQGNATAVELKITTLSVLQSTLSTGTITANTAYGGCGAWTAGSNALSKSGGAATTGSPVSIPTVTQSRLGNNGTNYFNGWLQKINYWPQRLTNSEVQAFSK